MDERIEPRTPEMIADNRYYIQTVLRHRRRWNPRRFEYQVRWASPWSDPEHDSWVASEDLDLQSIIDYWFEVGYLTGRSPSPTSSSEEKEATIDLTSTEESSNDLDQRECTTNRRSENESPVSAHDDTIPTLVTAPLQEDSNDSQTTEIVDVVNKSPPQPEYHEL